MRTMLWIVSIVALTGGSTNAEEWVVDLRPQFEELGLGPKSQSPRGTCSVFAVCGAYEYEWARATGEPTRLSEEYLNWARHRVVPAGSDGGCFHQIIPGLQRYGVCAEGLMPYQRDWAPELPPTAEALADGAPRRGVDVVWLKEIDSEKGFTDHELQATLKALREGHPVPVGLSWYKGRDCLDSSALLDMGAVEGTGSGHSVILVGYRLDETLPGGGAFVVRDHKGAGFGDGGYLQMPFGWYQKQANDALFLQPLRNGSVEVTSDPPGAAVIVSGRWAGLTPAKVADLPAGRRRVRVGLPGRWCVERTVTVRPGETATVQVALAPDGPPPVAEAGSRWTHQPSGVTFVSVPAPPEEPARLVLQAPAPEGPLWVGRTEVSNAQFREFVHATGYAPQGGWAFRPEQADLPVARVTYDDAAAFCEWVGGRLPTEGEWEWAGRGPKLPPFPWGAVMDLSRYVGGGTPTGGRARPVGSLPAGASWCGALDIVGNVSEWCLEVVFAAPADGCRLFADPDKAKKAVLRGGSYVHGGAACRPTWRYIGPRSGSGDLDGFRAAIPAIAASG